MKKMKKVLSTISCVVLIMATICNGIVSYAEEDATTNYLAVASYRGQDGNTAPDAPEGKVFAGWYKDEALLEPWDQNITEEKAYAKFVDADVLTVKFQLTAGVSLDASESNLRILTSIDSLNYQSVGFKFTLGGQVQTYNMKNVYSMIQGIENGDPYTYEPNVFSEESAYFGALTIANIPNRVFETIMGIIPTWTTLDGTVVEGSRRATTVKSIIKEEILLDNPNGADSAEYIFDKATTQGQIVTFDLNVTPVQDVSVWLIGYDSEGTSLGEWFALQYANGVTNQTIAVEMKEDAPSFKIRVKYNDAEQERTQNVTTISNLTVRDSGIITNADGSMTVYNGSGSRSVKVPIATGDFQVGDIVSFDIDINTDEKLAIYVRGRDAGGTIITGEKMHVKEYNPWDGKKTITAKAIDCEGVKTIEVMIQYRKFASSTATANAYRDNVVTISNIEITK